MSDRRFLFGAALLVAILITACLIGVSRIDWTQPDVSPAPVRERSLGEKIVLSQSGLYGVSLVKVAKAHVRKLRKGPFTIGAINELVLEDVDLTLPVGYEELGSTGTGEGSDNDESQTAPAAMLDKLGLNASHLRLGMGAPRFSALSISSLTVSRLEGTNAVPWFAARHAEAKRSGLLLEDGWSVEDGRRTEWKEAFLVFRPELRVIPSFD